VCVCARAVDKECHRICVCPRQRYRVAGLLECERGQVQFVSVAWIPTYSARLSVCGGGEGGLINYRGTMAGICVEEERGLPHVLREIDLPHVLREIDRHPCICVGEE
jgi:hypothetical protein